MGANNIGKFFEILRRCSQIRISLTFLFFLSFVIVLILAKPENHDSDLARIIDKTHLTPPPKITSTFNSLQQWELPNFEDGGNNSLVTINYNKCIPIAQCKFEDCDIEGSHNGKGSFCLPVEYSNIGDWAPDIKMSIFGVPILDNPDVYTAPVEHTQASARLPDKDGNAYFMFSNSQNYYGFLWVVEVQGVDSHNPQHISGTMPANVVWWQKLNKCRTIAQCNEQENPGNYNHPARINLVGSTAAIAFQNYSFTLAGQIALPGILAGRTLPIPDFMATSTLPKYPKIRSADAIAFYDVSNPREPKFIRKLIGDNEETWGGKAPGRDISEVAITKVGNYYHMNVGGTIYNYKNKGENKLFYNNYRMNSPISAERVLPLLGNVHANSFANVQYTNGQYPTSVSINSVPYYENIDGHLEYALTVQLISSKIAYNNNGESVMDESTRSVYVKNQSILSSHLMHGEMNESEENYDHKKRAILADLYWMSEACKRAWGFQMLDNGGYNVVCHDMDPMGDGISSAGRFIVRGISPVTQLTSSTY